MRIAIGQFGAPTVVLNASLHGALSVLDEHGAEVFGVVGGAHGLAHGDWISLSGCSSSSVWLQYTPGAALRAGRHARFRDVVEDAVCHLKQREVDGLLVMGGNGSMGLAELVQQTALAQGYDLKVVGVPKTIDNDVVGVDHTPGYPSAAHFVLKALRDLAKDLEAMVGFEQVRVVEVMGRRTGWLAAAASLLPLLTTFGSTATFAQPLIYLPHQPLSTNELLKDVVHQTHQFGQTMIVVSEGVRDISGRSITQMGDDTGNSADFILGGIGGHMAHLIRTQLGYGVRYENLGLLQRCWAESSLPLDRREARRLGQQGAAALLAGEGGFMVGLARTSRGTAAYQTEVVRVGLADVAGKERQMTAEETRLDEGFVNWLKPLIGLDRLQPHAGLSGLNDGHEGGA